MMLLAKALYDNIADSPDELAMRRGDILTVLERDTSGLEGWWLCSLNGRRGIVPGNRLRVLDNVLGQREMALMNAKLSYPERSASQKEWHNPNKVVIPQRLGTMFVYDVPKRLSPSGHYDIPPSRLAPSSAAYDYDHPAGCRPPTDGHPPVQHRQANVDHYDVPGSNRSSTVSMMSTGSNVSAASSGSGQQSSLGESEASSLELSGQELYDVPPPARAAPTPTARRLPPAATSVDSPTYDTPRWRGHGQKHSKSLDMLDEACDSLKSAADRLIADDRSAPIGTYSLPRPSKPAVSRNCSADSGISLAAAKHRSDGSSSSPSAPTYDVPIPQQYDTPARCKHLGDDDQDYDRPPKARPAGPTTDGTSPADLTVYDVPPRVTKDTGGDSLEQQAAADDGTKRPSSGSSDSDGGGGAFPYEELRMELTAAMESIVGLQHSVNSSCSKLLSFVHPDWRHPDKLEPQIYQIKLSALSLQTAGDEFVRFAQGALANAAGSDDRRLAKKLRSAIESLSALLTTFADCLQRLNKDMWPLVKLVRDEERAAAGQDDDDLDVVVRIARDIPECVRRISGLIQGNSLVLFRRGGGADSSGASAAQPPSTPKPKARQPPPPPPVKPKPRLSLGNGNGAPLAKFVSKSVESTPTAEQAPRLQTSPTTTTTATEISAKQDKEDKRGSVGQQVDYDVPKASQAKTASVGVDSSTDERGLPDGATTGEEYDYVSLTKEPYGTKRPPPPPTTDVRAAESDDERDDDRPVYAQVQKKPAGGRQVTSLFPPPPTDDSPDEASRKLDERLEQLRKDAEEPVRIHSAAAADDYDVPRSRPVATGPPSRSPSVSAVQLPANDRQMLAFYAAQMERHSAMLTNAIEAFVRCIDEERPPKAFIGHSKFVILAAHKLVYIGDTLTRHLANDNLRNDVMSHAYTLCELLKGTVTATKKAALEFPAVQAVQDMVDKVSEVSVAASRFRSLLSQFAS